MARLVPVILNGAAGLEKAGLDAHQVLAARSGEEIGELPRSALAHRPMSFGEPLALAEAVHTLAHGRRVAVDVGEMNGTRFLNNSSLGLYPGMVRERNRRQRRLGCNQYLMEGFDIGRRTRLDAGHLSIYTTQRSTPAGLLTPRSLHVLVP